MTNDNNPADDDALFDLANDVMCTVIGWADDTEQAARVLLLAAHQVMRDEPVFGRAIATSDMLRQAATEAADAFHTAPPPRVSRLPTEG